MAAEVNRPNRPHCTINDTPLYMPVKMVHTEPNEACEKKLYQLQAATEIMARAIFQGKMKAECPFCRQDFEEIALEKSESDTALQTAEQVYEFKVTDSVLILAEQMAQKAKKNGHNLTMKDAIAIKELLWPPDEQRGVAPMAPEVRSDEQCDLMRLVNNLRSSNAGGWVFFLGLAAGGVLVANQLWKGVFGTSLLSTQNNKDDERRGPPTTTVDLNTLRSRVTHSPSSRGS